MVTLKTLAPSEYGILANLADGFVPPDQENSIAIVGADAHLDVVSRIFAVRPWHIEGPWIAEHYRGSGVLKRMVGCVEKELRTRGVTRVLAYGADPELSGYLRRLGYDHLPLTVWMKDLA